MVKDYESIKAPVVDVNNDTSSEPRDTLPEVSDTTIVGQKKPSNYLDGVVDLHKTIDQTLHPDFPNGPEDTDPDKPSSGGGSSATPHEGQHNFLDPADSDFLDTIFGDLFASMGNDAKDTLTRLFNILGFNPTANSVTNGKNLVDILRTISQYADPLFGSLSGDELVQLSSTIYNALSGYTTSLLNQFYDRENWMRQNEYNSPLASMARLADAGINAAFYYGCLGSSNASEIGENKMQGSSMETTPVDSSNLARWSNGLSAASGLVTAVSGAASIPGSVANAFGAAHLANEQAQTIKATRPSDISVAESNAAIGMSDASWRDDQNRANYTQSVTQSAANDASANSSNAQARSLNWGTSFSQLQAPSILESLRLNNNLTRATTFNELNRWPMLREQLYSAQKVAGINAGASMYSANMAYKSAIAGYDNALLQSLIDSHVTETYNDVSSFDGTDNGFSHSSGNTSSNTTTFGHDITQQFTGSFSMGLGGSGGSAGSAGSGTGFGLGGLTKFGLQFGKEWNSGSSTGSVLDTRKSSNKTIHNSTREKSVDTKKVKNDFKELKSLGSPVAALDAIHSEVMSRAMNGTVTPSEMHNMLSGLYYVRNAQFKSAINDVSAKMASSYVDKLGLSLG